MKMVNAMILFFLGAFSAFGATRPLHHSDLSEKLGFTMWSEISGTDPDVVIMNPMFVEGERVDEPSAATRELERLFNPKLDDRAEIRKVAFGNSIELKTEKPVLHDPLEDLFVFDRNIATKLEGFQLGSNFTLRVRNSSLVWKLGKNGRWTIGLKPYHHGLQIKVGRT